MNLAQTCVWYSQRLRSRWWIFLHSLVAAQPRDRNRHIRRSVLHLRTAEAGPGHVKPTSRWRGCDDGGEPVPQSYESTTEDACFQTDRRCPSIDPALLSVAVPCWTVALGPSLVRSVSTTADSHHRPQRRYDSGVTSVVLYHSRLRGMHETEHV